MEPVNVLCPDGVSQSKKKLKSQGHFPKVVSLTCSKRLKSGKLRALDTNVTRDPGDLTVSDLAQDSLFIQWVRDKDPVANAFWTTWVMNHPEVEEKIVAARSIVLAMQFQNEKMSASQIHAEWNRTYSIPTDDNASKVRKVDWFRRKSFLSVAAALLLLIVFTPLAYLLLDRYTTDPQETPLQTRSTSRGQKLTLTLSDGTKIKLNSDSEIKYPERFSNDRREVFLKGEAFFDVQHSDHIPFKVHSAGVTVVVMGTSFNVSAYPENTDVKVALENGKVRIKMSGSHEDKDDIFLKPNEMIEINKSSYNFDVHAFDPVEMTSWKDGYLFLGKTGFDETVVKLERWFGVQFEIDSTFKKNPDWRFIGKFQNKSLPYILETLSYPSRFKYKIEAQKVFIY
jgi:ferric-dicitrate binding protein FerR (iron transport regulator)